MKAAGVRAIIAEPSTSASLVAQVAGARRGARGDLIPSVGGDPEAATTSRSSTSTSPAWPAALAAAPAAPLMLDFLWLPFLACLVLTGIHVYLGLHVLARGVIFVDLALAQVAALGISVAFLAGHPIQSDAAYWYALAFTVGGAALFAASRAHRAPMPQEAVIGIVYAVSAAAAVLVVDRAPQGGEHIKTAAGRQHPHRERRARWRSSPCSTG